MKHKKYTNSEKSVFNKVIRIRGNQVRWMRNNLIQYKTDAGRLDVIINFYRRSHKASLNPNKMKLQIKHIKRWLNISKDLKEKKKIPLT